MALRDQPYIPLYIQDFLTDEKLIECSAATTGVYVRLMCIMHKSDDYGKILLRQKDKQTDKQINNFALKVAKQLPYDLSVIIDSLTELLDENVLYVEGDYLCQKRMISDNDLSLKRSEAGSKGGKVHAKNSKSYEDFAKAKTQANPESEYEYVNNILNGHFEKNVDEKKQTMVVVEMMRIWMKHRPDYTGIVEADYPALLDISYIMAKSKGWQKSTVVGEHEQDILDGWEKICAFLSGTEADRFLRSLTIDGISIPKNFQKVVESMKVGKSAVIQKQKEAEKGRITHEQYFKE